MTDDAETGPAAGEGDDLARLAGDLPPVTMARKRRARRVVDRPALKSDRPRCPACGYFFDAIDSWTCPRCTADLREIGFDRPRDRAIMRRFAAMLRAIGRRLRRRPRSGMACGRCEYPARGVSGFDCPECGSDLRSSIIDRDRIDRWGAAALAATLWTVLIVTAAMLLSDWLSTWAIPQHMSRRSGATLTGMGGFIPDAPDYVVNISATGAATQWRWQGKAPIAVMTVTIKRKNRFVALRLDVENDTYSSTSGIVDDYTGNADAAGDVGSGFTGAVLGNAMRPVGLDPKDAAVQAQGEQIIDAIFAVQDDTIDSLASGVFIVKGGTQVRVRPSQDHAVLIPLYWMALWLGVIAVVAWVLWRRWRKERDGGAGAEGAGA